VVDARVEKNWSEWRAQPKEEIMEWMEAA
jgi:hypothetical protein